jgi:hypothetical protein
MLSSQLHYIDEHPEIEEKNEGITESLKKLLKYLDQFCF